MGGSPVIGRFQVSAGGVVSGDTITIFISQDRMIVEGGKQERTKGIFYPRDDKKTAAAAPAKAGQPQCAN